MQEQKDVDKLSKKNISIISNCRKYKYLYNNLEFLKCCENRK